MISVVEAVIGPLIGLIFILTVCVLTVLLSRQTDNSETELSKRNINCQTEDIALSPMSFVEHDDAENYQLNAFQSPASVQFYMLAGETPGGPLPQPIWPIRHVLHDGRPAPRDINIDDHSSYFSTQYHPNERNFKNKAQSMSMHTELQESFGMA